MADDMLNKAYKMYDVRDAPGELSTSIPTRSFQTKVQEADLVSTVDGDGWERTGLIISASGQGEEELNDESTLQDGHARVWWLGADEWPEANPSVHEIDELTVLDRRSFCKGLPVAPISDPSKQGVIQDVDVKVKARLLSQPQREVLLHATQLYRVHPFNSDTITVAPTPETSPIFCAQRKVHIDVLVKFPDSSYCVIQDATSAGWLKNETEMMTVPRGCPDTFFYPGQVLTAPRAFKDHGKYLVGKWKKGHRKGTVVRIVPVGVTAKVLAGSEKSLKSVETTEEPEDVEDDDEEVEEEEEEEIIDDGASLLDSYKGFSSDDEMLDTDTGVYLSAHPSHVYPVDNFMHEDLEFGDIGIIDEALYTQIPSTETTTPTDLSSPTDPALECPRTFPPLMEGTCPLVLGATEIKKANSSKKWRKTRRHLYRLALKSKRTRAVMEADCKRSALVIGTETRIKIQWQDGTVSDWEHSKNYYTLHHTQEFEHFPREFVKPASEFIQNTVAAKGGVSILSCYDLSPAIDCFGAPGDLVLYCPRTVDTISLPHPQSAEGADTWACPICTLINPKERPRCEACMTTRPPGISDCFVPPSGLNYDGTVLHLLGCGGTPVLNPLGEKASKACVGIVQSTDYKERVASVRWLHLPEHLVTPEPVQSSKAAEVYFPTTADKLHVGVITQIQLDGSATVKWHRHGPGGEGPPKTLPVTDLLMLDYAEDEPEEHEDGMDQTGGVDVRQGGDDQEAEVEGDEGKKGILGWGKVLVTKMTEMMTRKKEEEEGKEEEEEEEEEEDEDEKFQAIGSFTEHAYLSSSPGCSNMKRVRQEWKLLYKSLPEGIRVISSETQPHLLQALICGPKYTPYHNSPYHFNIMLPPQFPHVPPTASIRSYGLRLNPNLYANGYICLSLLGTWAGYQQCETWNETSTLLQVLISIQALVLTKEPYYNEAGYHNHLGTSEGRQNSRAYNEQIYLLVLRHLTMLLQKPPLHFAGEVLGFAGKNWEGIVSRARSYLADIDEGAAFTTHGVPSGENDKEKSARDEAGDQAVDKKMITTEEMEKYSNFLNEDGLILPVSKGFAVSLRTSVLPQLILALKESGLAKDEVV